MWALFLLSAMGFAIAAMVLIYIGHVIYLLMMKDKKEQEIKLKNLNADSKKEESIKGENKL